jgi:hypothetical protein
MNALLLREERNKSSRERPQKGINEMRMTAQECIFSEQKVITGFDLVEDQTGAGHSYFLFAVFSGSSLFSYIR